MRRVFRGSDSVVTIVFLLSYILIVGAVTYINVVLLELAEDYSHWQAWLALFWPLWVVFFAPAAVAALLAAWWSKQSLRNAAKLLAAFLAMIVIVMEATAVSEPLIGARYGQLVLMGAVILLAGAFFLVAYIRRCVGSPLLE